MWIIDFLKRLIKPTRNEVSTGVARTDERVYPWQTDRQKPPVYFERIRVVERTPQNSAVETGQIYLVEYNSKKYWTMFQCPCGCGEVAVLPHNAENGPSWKISESSPGRPDLFPSIWMMKGCFSHFWVNDGRIYWCNNSGIQPWIAEPSMYKRPPS